MESQKYIEEPCGMDNSGQYFHAYEDLEVHHIMLSDKRRNLAYKEAIESNKKEFNNKIVLDVGAGTGFLSILCAKAGASKVYAVEASESIMAVLRETCKVNNVHDIVEVVSGAIEEIELPEKVDIIISEWMGFYLLHEGMLSSVIWARDNFLKSDGILIPDRGRINACLCKVPSMFDFWDDVDGVDLSHIGARYRMRYLNKPAIMDLHANNIVGGPVAVVELNLESVTNNDLKSISRSIVFSSKDDESIQGLCLSFDVMLLGRPFSTSPFFPPTHWKQSVIVFPEAIEVQAGEAIAYKITMTRVENNRRYLIEVSSTDVDEVDHEIGCECSYPKCRIISAYLKQQSDTDNRIE